MGKKKTIEFISNMVIFLLLIVSIILVFIYVGGDGSALLNSFKYFTIQSNVLMGVSAFISLWYVKRGSPLWLSLLKYVATCSVFLTFITVMTYLGPIYGYDFLLGNANALMHLIIPVLAIVHLILLEPKLESYKFVYTVFSIVPMGIYGAAYLINVGAHNGYGDISYDWYQFGRWGLGIGFLCFLIMMILMYLIGVGLFYAYKKVQIKKGNE